MFRIELHTLMIVLAVEPLVLVVTVPLILKILQPKSPFMIEAVPTLAA